MATQLAKLSGFNACCIGFLDGTTCRLKDSWTGFGASDDLQQEGAAARIITRALEGAAPAQLGHKALGNQDSAAQRSGDANWVQTDHCLIGFGNRIGNAIAVIVFFNTLPNQPVTEQKLHVARVGITYADQLLEERVALTKAQKQPRLPEIILRSISFGLAVSDDQGKLIYMSDSCKSWLQENTDLYVLDDRLTARIGQDQAQLTTAIVAATGSERKTSMLRFGSHDGRMETVTIMPIGEAPQLALIVFGQENAGDTAIRDLLLETLGLTAAERRLAHQLFCGKSLSAAAKASNLTISTARSYLKSIFAKTGIHRQSELITLYHNMMPPVRLLTKGEQEKERRVY